MQLEAIRIIADWLADDSTGYSVNELLDTVELDGADERPNDVEVYDSTRDGWVSRKRLSREGSSVAFPALVVMLASELTAPGTPQSGNLRIGEIPIAIGYVEEDKDHASGTAAALYTLRAVSRSLTQLNLNDYATSHRTRGNVYLEHWTDYREGEAGVKWNDAVVTAALITVWRIRDQAANPPTS